MNARAIAAKILLQVIIHHRSLTACFAEIDPKNNQSNLIKELCFGVCRWYFRLVILADKLLGKPLKTKDKDIYLLLLLGLYQILYLNLPNHVAVLETVEAARTLKKPWATKFINGVLRNFLRQQEQLLAVTGDVEHYAHPAWLIDALQNAYPEHWQTILNANNQHPPLCLRVNPLKTTTAGYLKNLAAQNILAHPVADSPAAVVLEQAQDIRKLPGFHGGYFSVQDSSAQFAASLLALEPGQRVLDACAAPGGKTTHMLETEPKLAQIVAVDKEAERVNKIKENVQRLQLPSIVQYFVADAAQTATWWDGNYFDRILIDAPCSGNGVIRRHPDIKVLRQPEDIQLLAKQQYTLLTALWPLLKPGGILVYATCSILPQENEAVIQRFLSVQEDARELKVPASWGIEKSCGRQIITGTENRDGFYYARLQKIRA